MVVADNVFKTSRVAEIVTTVSMRWEERSVSGQKMCPLQQPLVQGHRVPRGHLEKRSLFILSLSSQVKLSHDLQTGVNLLTLDIAASADILFSDSLKIMFN